MSQLARRDEADITPFAKELTDEQVALIKKTVAKNATNDELALFLYQAKRTGLDPLAKQLHFVVRGLGTDKRQATIQTGIDGYRVIAARTGVYAGNDDPIYDDEANPRKATVTVYKVVGGVRCPFTASARWDQYYPGDRQGFMWKKMPHLMLGKCAEALALRKAFPAELSGVYTHEEMESAGETIDGEIVDAGQDWKAPEGLSENDCPKCGSPVYDNRETATGRQPVWRCSNSNCTGGSNGKSWASWNKDEFSGESALSTPEATSTEPQAVPAPEPANSTQSASPPGQSDEPVPVAPPGDRPSAPSVDGAVYAQLLIDALDKDLKFPELGRAASVLMVNYSPVPHLTKPADIDALVDSHPDFLKALCDKLGLTQPAQQVIA